MSTDLTVYRSTNPEVLARWQDTKDAVKVWGEKLKAALQELGLEGRKVYYDELDGRILGVLHDDGEVPKGWRIDRRTGYLVPRLSTKKGKEIEALFADHRRPDPRALVGMPKQVFVGLFLLTCGLRLMDGALYVTWEQAIPEDGVDLALWEHVKLSEYYAAVERKEAAELAGIPA